VGSLPAVSKHEYLSQFFQDDGKAVIVPIDHGTAIPVPGLEDPAGLIERLNPFADGYVVNLGLANACCEQLAGKGICFRTDVYKPAPDGHEDEGSYLVYSIDEALEIGAHAVMNMCYPHHREEARMIRECAELISQSLQTNVPVILETLPFGLGRPADYTVANIRFAVRLAAELGADVVKTAYPGERREFERIVDECYVPVVVLGGAAGDDTAILRMVADSMQAGASGVAIGRNVWQHRNPPRMAAALRAIVHDGASAEAAAKILESGTTSL